MRCQNLGHEVRSLSFERISDVDWRPFVPTINSLSLMRHSLAFFSLLFALERPIALTYHVKNHIAEYVACRSCSLYYTVHIACLLQTVKNTYDGHAADFKY